MKKCLMVGAMALASMIVLSSCSAPPATQSGKSAESTPASGGMSGAAGGSNKMKACMVSDGGGFDDQSFNQSGKEGLERAHSELGIEVKFAESKNESDYQKNTNAMIQDGCTLVFGIGFHLTDALTTAAKANPNVQFALVDSPFKDSDKKTVEFPNARPLIFNTAEAAFLAGYVSASNTASGKVATYGGMEIPTVQIFMQGFAKGVEEYNKDNGTSIQVLGWDMKKKSGSFVGDFTSTSKGQQLTAQFIAQGADIIMPVAGPVGLGTLAAIKAAPNADKLKAIWVDSDGQKKTGDKHILTSVVKEIGNAVFATAKDAQDGKFTSKAYVGNLKNKGVALAPFHDFDSQISPDVKKKLEELTKQVVAGTLDVSTEYDPAN